LAGPEKENKMIKILCNADLSHRCSIPAGIYLECKNPANGTRSQKIKGTGFANGFNSKIKN
jgi:hypothetical protein